MSSPPSTNLYPKHCKEMLEHRASIDAVEIVAICVSKQWTICVTVVCIWILNSLGKRRPCIFGAISGDKKQPLYMPACWIPRANAMLASKFQRQSISCCSSLLAIIKVSAMFFVTCKDVCAWHWWIMFNLSSDRNSSESGDVKSDWLCWNYFGIEHMFELMLFLPGDLGLDVSRAAAIVAFNLVCSAIQVSHCPVLQELCCRRHMKSYRLLQQCCISESYSESIVGPITNPTRDGQGCQNAFLSPDLELIHISFLSGRQELWEVVPFPVFCILHWGWVRHPMVLGVTGVQLFFTHDEEVLPWPGRS